MCNARRFVSGMLLLCAPPLAGQIDALRARSDSLLAEWHQANAFAQLQDSLRRGRERGGRDTIRAGSLSYLVNPSPLPLAAAAAIAWPQVERFYGPAAQAFAHRPFVIQALDPDTTVPVPPGSALRIPWDTDAHALARLLLVVADLGTLDPRLHEWLGGPVIPQFDAGPVHAAAYVQLVTAPSRTVRRCLSGERSACSDALSLTDAADPATLFYGPEERRMLALTQYGFIQAAHQEALRSCAAGSDSSCLELLRSLPPGALMRPLDYSARITMLETAVRLGGPEMFQRLLETPHGAMGQRLAAAARVSEDSLVGRWRADVLAARPTPVPLPPWELWVALGWVAVFATGAARSSRWRID